MVQKNVKITKRENAFKGFASSYNVETLNSLTLNYNLKILNLQLKINLKKSLTESRELKFVTTLVLVFKKIECDDETKYDTFCSNSKAEIIVNESDINDVFQSIYSIIMSNIQKSLRKCSGWIID